MTWIAARALFGGALKKLGQLNLWQLLCIGLALFAGLQTIRLAVEKRHAAKTEAQLLKCDQQRHADREAYAKTQADAQAANRAHIQTETKLREQINEASRSGFVADRDRLRAQSSAPQSVAGGTAISSVPKAAPGTPPEVLSLPPAELLRAQETELQLNALIDWVLKQSAVDPNGVSK